MNHNAQWMLARDACSGLARWDGNVQPTRLAKLCKEMGVCWPVKIRRMAGVTRNGTHRTKLSQGHFGSFYHSITMSTYLSVYQANATLKHELEHAAQVERAAVEGKLPTDFQKVYKRENRSQGYRRNIYEIEAREASLKYPDPIVQRATLTDRETERARNSFPQHWLPHLSAYQRTQAASHDLPAMREHFAQLLDEEKDVQDLFAPVEIRGMDEAIDHARLRFLTRQDFRFRGASGTVMGETAMSDKPDERREVEAKLKAWRDERNLPQPEHGVWNAMVDKALARTRTNVQTP